MRIIAKVLVFVLTTALFTGCQPHHTKEDLVLKDLGPPSFEATASWTGSWQDPKRGTSESFTMELVQTGAIVKGTAVFMDGNGTKADIAGQATGSKIRLVMSPHPTAPYHSIPETTWIGSVTSGGISGTWYFHGTTDSGYASTGPWSASTGGSSKATPKPSTK